MKKDEGDRPLNQETRGQIILYTFIIAGSTVPPLPAVTVICIALGSEDIYLYCLVVVLVLVWGFR